LSELDELDEVDELDELLRGWGRRFFCSRLAKSCHSGDRRNLVLAARHGDDEIPRASG
jgi:hypothetical protein